MTQNKAPPRTNRHEQAGNNGPAGPAAVQHAGTSDASVVLREARVAPAVAVARLMRPERALLVEYQHAARPILGQLVCHRSAEDAAADHDGVVGSVGVPAKPRVGLAAPANGRAAGARRHARESARGRLRSDGASVEWSSRRRMICLS